MEFVDDPFEARLAFLDLLHRLNASQQSIQRACQFALKHSHLHEELYACVVEEMEQVVQYCGRGWMLNYAEQR